MQQPAIWLVLWQLNKVAFDIITATIHPHPTTVNGAKMFIGEHNLKCKK